jgi:hypothetical protein
VRFLIINTDYPEFLRWLYGQHPGLEGSPYEQQMRVRSESLFGVADFYSSNLRRLGHEAYEIHANNRFLQTAWAREHGLDRDWGCRRNADSSWRAPFWISKRLSPRRLKTILAWQIRHYRPDVLLNQDV